MQESLRAVKVQVCPFPAHAPGPQRANFESLPGVAIAVTVDPFRKSRVEMRTGDALLELAGVSALAVAAVADDDLQASIRHPPVIAAAVDSTAKVDTAGLVKTQCSDGIRPALAPRPSATDLWRPGPGNGCRAAACGMVDTGRARPLGPRLKRL